jgi:hypothetical protein
MNFLKSFFNFLSDAVKQAKEELDREPAKEIAIKDFLFLPEKGK